jgi:hypothetical protein
MAKVEAAVATEVIMAGTRTTVTMTIILCRASYFPGNRVPQNEVLVSGLTLLKNLRTSPLFSI